MWICRILLADLSQFFWAAVVLDCGQLIFRPDAARENLFSSMPVDLKFYKLLLQVHDLPDSKPRSFYHWQVPRQICAEACLPRLTDGAMEPRGVHSCPS